VSRASGSLPLGWKKCGRCKLPKRPWFFYANKANDDGLQGVCRECNTVVTRQTELRRVLKRKSDEELQEYIKDIEWRRDAALKTLITRSKP
jgi:hypothetical protein